MPLPPLREQASLDIETFTARYNALVDHLSKYGAIDHIALPEASTIILEVFNAYKDCKTEDIHVLATDIDSAKSDIAILEKIAAEISDHKSQLEYKKHTKTKLESLKLKVHILQYFFQTLHQGYAPEITFQSPHDRRPKD